MRLNTNIYFRKETSSDDEDESVSRLATLDLPDRDFALIRGVMADLPIPSLSMVKSKKNAEILTQSVEELHCPVSIGTKLIKLSSLGYFS